MKLITTLSRAAGLGLCVVAFSGTALADPGNGNGNAPATPPGQEKKAETPAAAAPAPALAPAPAPQAAAAPGQEKKAEKQEAKAEKKAAPAPAAAKPAKAEKEAATKAAKPAAKPAKTSGSYKNTSSGTDLKKGMAHKHTICHATGSAKNPYVRITPSVSGVFNGHIGHQDDGDIVPSFTYRGSTYSQNWDAAGQAIFNAGCATPATSSTPPPLTESKQESSTNCPATVTTTEQVLVGIWHATGAYNKDGTRKYVLISPSKKSAHWDKHADDKPAYETRTVTRTRSGENCATVTSTSNTSNSSNPSSTSNVAGTANVSGTANTQTASQAAPVGGVAGAVSPTVKKPKAKSAGGVLGAIASAPESIAKTAATGTLPFTGLSLWMAALIAVALLLGGLMLRRRTTA